MLEKADGKRRLERIVIQKEKFRSFSKRGAERFGNAGEEGGWDREMQEILEGEGWSDDDEEELEGKGGGRKGKRREILSKKDLETLTDRSEEAYARAEKGEDKGANFKTVESKKGDKDILASMG